MPANMAEHPFSKYRLYVVLHKKERRRMACLVVPGGKERTTISYARYLMAVSLGRMLTSDETVDHVNGDALDDRVENLQILSLTDNVRKSARRKTYIEFLCPVCGSVFSRELRQLHGTKADSPCCSRRCGGVKSQWAGSRAVRQRTHNSLVVGSNPTPPTTLPVRRIRRVRVGT